MSYPIRFEGEPHDDQIAVPRAIVIGLVALVLFCIIAVGVGRIMQVGVTHEARLTPLRSVTFRYQGEQIGHSALVATTSDGRRLMLTKPGEEIFPRLILRSVSNIRQRDGADPRSPLSLIVTADGQRLLVDPATHRALRLAAFGPTNGRSFDVLFPRAAS